ncbi:MAG TPA: SMC family ATPase [archaeon]|nr:SMC family ATPase [archaeon]
MIKKVVLDNWKSHKHSVFEFGKGTNVLVGVMGSGKTSVVDAVSFALFGTFPALRAKKLRLEDVITSKPYVAGSARVQVDFDNNNQVFTAVREVDRKGKTSLSELRVNGKLVEGPMTQRVNLAIERVTGMDYDLFSKAVYAEQNEIDYFLKLGVGERKKKIDELLELHKYENARQNATFVLNRLRERGLQKEQALERVAGELSGVGERELIEGLKATSKELEALKAYGEALGQRLKTDEARLEELKARKEKFEALQRSSHQLQGSVDQLKAQADALAERHGTTHKTLEEISSDYADAELKFKALKARDVEREEVALKEKEVSTNKKALEEELARAMSELGAYSGYSAMELKRLAAEATAESSEFAGKYKAFGEELLRLGETVAGVAGRIESRERQASDNKKQALELRELEKMLQGFDEKYPELEKMFKEKEQLLQASKVEASINEKTVKELREGAGRLVSAKDSCPVCGHALDEEHKKKVIEEKRAKMSELEEKAREAKERADALMENYEELKSVIERKADISRKVELLGSFEKREQDLQKEIAYLEGERKKFTESLFGKRQTLKGLEEKKDALARKTQLLESNLEKALKAEALAKGIEAASREVVHMKALLERIKSEVSRENLEALEGDLEKLRALKQLVVARRELGQKKALLEEALEKARALEFNEKEFVHALESVGKAGAELREKRVEEKRLEDRVTEARKKIEVLEKLKAEKEQLEGEVEKTHRAEKSITLLKNSLLETQTKLREAFVDSTNEAMEELWRKIYPYSDYESVRIAIDSGDYVLQLKEKEKVWKNVEAVASGGERSAAALALRLAFSLILAQKLSWVILDEPTHNLDDRGIEKMAELLRDGLPQLIDQVFVITHEEKLKRAGNGSTHVIHRNKDLEEWASIERVN